MLDTAADAATTTNRKRELLLHEMAAKLAKKIFNLKCKASTLMMRWRKDKQDIEVITGYTAPSSDRRKEKRLMEFDKAKIYAYEKEAMSK